MLLNQNMEPTPGDERKMSDMYHVQDMHRKLMQEQMHQGLQSNQVRESQNMKQTENINFNCLCPLKQGFASHR